MTDPVKTADSDDRHGASDWTDAEWGEIFRASVEAAYDAVLITDADLERPGPRIVYVNPAFCEMTGWARDEIIGKTPRVLQGKETDPEVLKRLRRALERGESFDARAMNYRRDGSSFQLEWRTSPIRNAAGAVTHYISIQRDVTAEERVISRLRRQADFDDLTGTLRRNPAHRAIRAEIKRAARHQAAFSLVMLDLDHFKTVNDEHGHSAADAVLKQLTRLLMERLREHDQLARMGGEEFLLILPHTGAAGAEQLAETLRARVEQATFVDHIRITISLGVYEYQSGDDPAAMLERADEALYAAKEAGRNRVRTQ